MARQFRRTILTALFVCGAAAVSAQDTPPPAPAPDAAGKADDSLRASPDRPGKFRRGGDLEDARRFEKMPPEQRERLRENLRRWQKMPPEERQDLREEEQRRRQRIEREIDEIIQKAGLQLSADQRQVFALRYAQERRKIEETLRREMEAKRRPMLDEVVERLKKELAAAAAASATPSATGK
jgi:flagellar biosynthesis GTPase FlhF